MTMVWGDPAGFAVDWDWQRGLTVWEPAGQRSGSRSDRKVLEHELPRHAPGGARRTTLRRSARPSTRGNLKQPGS
jgi:hypothetical protein